MRSALLARVSILALVVAATTVACAGGGGGGTASPSPGVPTSPPPPPSPPASPPPPPPPPPISYPSSSSAEYQANWGVADSKAITAWQDGIAGTGITIAVIDSGVDGTNAEMAGRLSSASEDMDSARNQLFDPSDTHGSEVAAIAAANFNNSSTVGIAFDATILALRADSASGDGSFPSNYVTAAINYATNYAINNNVPVIINMSLGFSGTLGPPNSDPIAAAIQFATSHGVIIVNAAGNDSAAQPEAPGNDASNAAVSNGLLVVAGAHDRNGNFASFSNQAGSQSAWYITAPGVNVQVPDFGAAGATNSNEVCGPNSSYGVAAGNCVVAGTSYASPAVAAALALLREAFPGMTPAQIVQLLLASADDEGAPGVDSQWGNGKLDIAKAFQSFGSVEAPLSEQGADVALAGPIGVAGPAFGDGFVRHADLWQAVGFDSFGRSFSVNLAQGWSLAPRFRAASSKVCVNLAGCTWAVVAGVPKTA